MTEPTLTIDHLSKTFHDVTAVDNLSLRVEAGELFGLLGPNGAGKTTTIHILCGLLKPTAGTARVCGFDIHTQAQEIKDRIGVCIQETAVYPYLTGTENIDLFGNLYTMDKKTLLVRRTMLLTKMGLLDDANRKAGKYSGGMKRRLSVILALIHDPSVAFLDEPTVAMDPQSRHALWDLIRELKGSGKTIVLTTHSMEEAEALCDRVGIIDHGRLIALGSPRQIIASHHAKNLEEVFIQLTGRTIREEA